MEKRKKRTVGILIGVGFFLIIVGLVTYFVLTYMNDQNETKKRMEKVEALYTTFKEDVTTFNEKRDSLYEQIKGALYYQTLKEKDSLFRTLFTDYEKALETLDKDYDKLKNRCINILYPDVSINNKCEAFIIAYEEATNTFVSDIKAYNENISEYNTWLKNTESQDEKLDTIKVSHDYIDVDGDRKYQGKEETGIGEVTDDVKVE